MFIEKNVVNGIWFETKETINIQNPATNETLGSVPKSGMKGAVQAVVAAADSLVFWSATTAHERSRLLKKWHDLIEDNKEVLAKIMTMEQGKPLNEAIGEN